MDASATRMVYSVEEVQTRHLNTFIDIKISASEHSPSRLASDSTEKFYLTPSMPLPRSELHAMMPRSNDNEPKTGPGCVSAIVIESSPKPTVIYSRLVQSLYTWVVTLIKWIVYIWIPIIWEKNVQVIFQTMQWIGWFAESMSTRLLPFPLAVLCVAYVLSRLICQMPFDFISNTSFCIARNFFETNDSFILSTFNHTTEQYSNIMEDARFVRFLPQSLATIQREVHRLQTEVRYTNLSHTVELYNELSELIEDEREFMKEIDKFCWDLTHSGREIDKIANRTIRDFQEIERKVPTGMRRRINRSVQILLGPVMDMVVRMIPDYLRPFLQTESLSMILNWQWQIHVKKLDLILDHLVLQSLELLELLSSQRKRLEFIRNLYSSDFRDLDVAHGRLLQKDKAHFVIRFWRRFFSQTQTTIVDDLARVEKQIAFVHRLDRQIQETEFFIRTLYRVLSLIWTHSDKLRSHLPRQIDLHPSRGTLDNANVIAALHEHIRQIDQRANTLREANDYYAGWEKEYHENIFPSHG